MGSLPSAGSLRHPRVAWQGQGSRLRAGPVPRRETDRTALASSRWRFESEAGDLSEERTACWALRIRPCIRRRRKRLRSVHTVPGRWIGGRAGRNVGSVVGRGVELVSNSRGLAACGFFNRWRRSSRKIPRAWVRDKNSVTTCQDANQEETHSNTETWFACQPVAGKLVLGSGCNVTECLNYTIAFSFYCFLFVVVRLFAWNKICSAT